MRRCGAVDCVSDLRETAFAEDRGSNSIVFPGAFDQ